MDLFLTVMSEYSFHSILLIIVGVLLYLLYLKPSLKDKFRIGNDKNEAPITDKARIEQLLSHEFFRNMDLKIGVELPISKYSDHPNRNMLLRDMTIILFTLYRSTMYSFCQKLNPKATSDELLKLLTDIHFEILAEFKHHCKDNEIPELASELYRTWFLENVKLVHHYAGNICKASVDTNTVDRVRTYLFVLQIVLISALNDLQKKPTINGQLNGISYKGLIIEDDIKS
jgi:hypothetical protein